MRTAISLEVPDRPRNGHAGAGAPPSYYPAITIRRAKPGPCYSYERSGDEADPRPGICWTDSSSPTLGANQADESPQ